MILRHNRESESAVRRTHQTSISSNTEYSGSHGLLIYFLQCPHLYLQPGRLLIDHEGYYSSPISEAYQQIR